MTTGMLPVRRLWLFIFVPVALLSVAVSLLGIHTYTQLLAHPTIATNSVDSACDVSSVLKPWTREVVTVVQPPVDRDCQLLRSSKQSQVAKVKEALGGWTSSRSYKKWTNNCSNIVKEFSNNFYLSREELNFPLAFTLTVYTNPEQALRLLKAIYRPHNLYCIHPDANEGEELASVFKTISICLDNVFIASNVKEMYHDYGASIIDAQLSCLRDFMMFPPQKWMYVINISGRELPVRTNREIVRSLKKLHGVSAVRTSDVNEQTWNERFDKKYYFDVKKGVGEKSQDSVGEPPHGIQLYKSMTYIAAPRSFANFILTSEIAKDFYDFLKDVRLSHEHFYASLYRLPGVPGGFNASLLGSIPAINHYRWMQHRDAGDCGGQVIRGVCILSLSELNYITKFIATMSSDPDLDVFFFNKYFMEKDHVVMDCMEERLLQQNLLEYRQDCRVMMTRVT